MAQADAATAPRRTSRRWLGAAVCLAALVVTVSVVAVWLRAAPGPRDLVWPIPAGTTVVHEEFHDNMGSSEMCEYQVLLRGDGSAHVLADVLAGYERRGLHFDNHLGDGSLTDGYYFAAWPGRDGGGISVTQSARQHDDLVEVRAFHAPEC